MSEALSDTAVVEAIKWTALAVCAAALAAAGLCAAYVTRSVASYMTWWKKPPPTE